MCPHCGFSLENLDKRYGKDAIHYRRVCDNAGARRQQDRMKLNALLENCLVYTSEEAPEKVRILADQRWQAKQNRDWTEADRLRAEVAALGWRCV